MQHNTSVNKPFRINFIGAPSSGKSFLAEQLFLKIKADNKHSVEIVPEWIRTELYKIGPMKTIWEQIRTCNKQRELELITHSDVVITDSGVTVGYFYACHHYQNTDLRDLVVLEDLYADLIKDIYTDFYDLVFYVPPIQTEKPKDAARYHDLNDIEQLDIHMRTLFTIVHKRANVFVVNSDIESRAEQINQIYQRFLK